MALTMGSFGRLLDTDYSLLRKKLGKDDIDMEAQHVTDVLDESPVYPAGSLVVLEDGRLGMAMGAIWQPLAFETVRGAEFAKQDGPATPWASYIGIYEASETLQEDQAVPYVRQTSYGSELVERWVGGLGTEMEERDIRILLLEGWKDPGFHERYEYFERSQIAWVLESEFEAVQAFYLHIVSKFLEGAQDAIQAIRTLSLLQPFQDWKQDIEEEFLLIIDTSGQSEYWPERKEEEKMATTTQAPAQPAQTGPKGPHAVVAVGNKVVAYAEFEPQWHGTRYSVPHGDERIRKLAERCQQLRAEGQEARLQFVVPRPAAG